MTVTKLPSDPRVNTGSSQWITHSPSNSICFGNSSSSCHLCVSPQTSPRRGCSHIPPSQPHQKVPWSSLSSPNTFLVEQTCLSTSHLPTSVHSNGDHLRAMCHPYLFFLTPMPSFVPLKCVLCQHYKLSLCLHVNRSWLRPLPSEESPLRPATGSAPLA